MILPAIIYFAIFNYAPMLGIMVAFKKYNYTQGILRSPWVGFDNFLFLYRSGTLFRVTRNTILYNIAFLILDIVCQVTTAIMFIPYFISAVLLASFVYNIFSYERGVLNNVLVSLGMDKFDAYNKPTAWVFILMFFH